MRYLIVTHEHSILTIIVYFVDTHTAKNTVISPNFLVWKFYGKAKFRIVLPYLPKLGGNCAFSQNFHTTKLGKITVFFTVTGVFTTLSNTWLRFFEKIANKYKLLTFLQKCSIIDFYRILPTSLWSISSLWSFKLFIFFTKRFRKYKKKKKNPRQKPKPTNKARIKTSKRVNIVCFAFLCFLCARRNENRKKRKVPTM